MTILPRFFALWASKTRAKQANIHTIKLNQVIQANQVSGTVVYIAYRIGVPHLRTTNYDTSHAVWVHIRARIAHIRCDCERLHIAFERLR